MRPASTEQKKGSRLTPYLTALGVWGLAFGCSVGQGAFVMPGNIFLPVAGPVGTSIGLALGMLVMLIFAHNYHLLMNRYPDCGGTYSYIRNCFGYDYGFLGAWFLVLTYMAVLWANASALPVIARILVGDVFRFGLLYENAGYPIYFGEIMLSLVALTAAAVLCLLRRHAARAQSAMGLLLLLGVGICLIAALNAPGASTRMFDPPYAPENTPGGGVITIFALAPWAFIGFESVSHSAEEMDFPRKRVFCVLAIALITAAAAYIALVLLAVTAVPEGCTGWLDYVKKLGSFEGFAAQPTFFAAQSALGNAGRAILCVAAFCGLLTGVLGNYIALSRLFCALAADKLLPSWIGEVDERHVPRRAIFVILAVSLILPFFGRTWISWIVDVTTVGATITFALISVAAWKTADQGNDRIGAVTGVLGTFVSVAFALLFLVPNLLSVTTLGTESYLILAVWSLLGFLMFEYLLRRDREHRFGRSSVALIVMMSLILFTSSIWMRQSSDKAIEQSVLPIHSYYLEQMEEAGVEHAEGMTENATAYLHGAVDKIDTSVHISNIIQLLGIVASLVILFISYGLILKREKKVEVEKALAEDASRAKSSFLSNMSHEIRTPMNAIIGLDNIALKNPNLQPETRDQLEKIGASARHLLGLINDILDMSRIESGRMVLKNEEFSFREIIEQINIIINGQCVDKGLRYQCNIIGDMADYYYGDDLKLKQVLINILGNSVKFTEVPGSVTFTVEKIGQEEDVSTLRFRMEDTGIGMDAEYIPKIFETFSQENATTTNRYGGSGLGMAITKNFVEMLGGSIEVHSQKGVGSVFLVTVPLKVSDRVASIEQESEQDIEHEKPQLSLAGRRVLMAEDMDQNAEILADLLELEDVLSERVSNGQLAVEAFSEKPAGYFDAILMDVRMPVMDGLNATRAIRALDRPDAKTIPIIAMTANVFDEDVENSLNAGMNAHLAKPIDPDRLYETLARLIAEAES